MLEILIEQFRISWLSFFLILAMSIIILFVYFLLLKPLLIRYERIANFNYHEIAVDRTIIFIVVLYLIFSFTLINPIVHGILIIVLILFSFHNISSFIHGITIMFETDLNYGNYISVGKYQGTVGHLGLTTIRVDSANKSHYFKYRNIDKTGISISKTNISTKIRTIICKLEVENLSEHEVIQLMKNEFFSFPFLNPNIRTEFLKVGNTYQIKFALKSDQYFDGIIDNLEQKGIKIITQLDKNKNI